MTRAERSRLIEKAKEGILEQERTADSAVRDLFFLYDEAAAAVENNISALIGRYAEQNNLSPALARQMLSAKEHSTWRMSLERYIESLPAQAEGSDLLLELNTLAMKSRISREEQLLGNIYQNMSTMAANAGADMSGIMEDIYRTNYERSVYNAQSAVGLGFQIAQINEEKLLSVLNFPWHGKTFSERIWGQSGRIAGQLRRELTLGFIKGSSVQEMARNVRRTFDATRYEAERLVRTEAKYFANQGELEGFKQNGIEQYRFVGGTEGSIGCDCKELNGQVFEVEDAMVGDNYPPIHPNCKCIVVAWFDKGLFSERRDAVPLSENVKFQQWKEKFALNSGGAGGTLRDVNGVMHAVTPESIARIPAYNLTGYDGNVLREQQAQVLELARNEPFGTEVSAFYAIDGTMLEEVIGGIGQTPARSFSGPYVSLHNHPSGLTFSETDIEDFLFNENNIVAAVAGNNGVSYVLEQKEDFNASGAMHFLENTKIRHQNRMDNATNYLSFMQEFLEGVGEYGYIYYR